MEKPVLASVIIASSLYLVKDTYFTPPPRIDMSAGEKKGVFSKPEKKKKGPQNLAPK